MRRQHCLTAAAVAASLLGGCACRQGTRQTCRNTGDASAHLAHEAYTTAINSNNLEAFLAMLTEDTVFMPPDSPRIVGKQAVREWAAPYLEAYAVHWDKTSLELVVAGEWAFEQYAYVENDTPKGEWPRLQDTGKGLIVYHRDDDGVWRVARDAWNSDLPTPE